MPRQVCSEMREPLGHGDYGSGKKDSSSYFSGLGNRSELSNVPFLTLCSEAARAESALSALLAMVALPCHMVLQTTWMQLASSAAEHEPGSWRGRLASYSCPHRLSSPPRARPPNTTAHACIKLFGALLGCFTSCLRVCRITGALQVLTEPSDPGVLHTQCASKLPSEYGQSLPNEQVLAKSAHGHAADNQAWAG